MRGSSAWSQDIVLRAMCEDIRQRRDGGITPDFILITGDLAFSGAEGEYKLVQEFFDALCAASTVPAKRVFCIPGNHDIERERQKMCFHGARGFVQNQSKIDLLLSDGDDLETLLKRQSNFTAFQKAYGVGQDRQYTNDGLGYVSAVEIEGVCLAIVALDSAWLAEGGISDHGKLVIGERQVIDALALATRLEPHIILAMAHHPFHLLHEADRLLVQRRIERTCHFYHCGHLHQPETRTVSIAGSSCLSLAAGASFETRHSHNSYSLVTLDLVEGKRSVEIIQYSPTVASFAFSATEDYPIEVTASAQCQVAELAQSIIERGHTSWAHYLAALVLDQKTDLPIPYQNSGHVFGSFAVLLGQPDSEYRQKVIEFTKFKNILRLFYKRLPLPDILSQHGEPVIRLGSAFENACALDPALRERLDTQERDAKAMFGSTEVHVSFTQSLLVELAGAREWEQLREQAERNAASSDPTVAILARRMLALSLANSASNSDRVTARDHYKLLLQEQSAEPTDVGNLISLLMDAGDLEDAKSYVLEGIAQFSNRAQYFTEIGMKIVESTGDRAFRAKLQQPRSTGVKS